MRKRLVLATMLLSLVASAPGCQREKGAMEKAGEKVDEAVDKVLHPNEGPLEKAGRKVDEAIEDAKDKAD